MAEEKKPAEQEKCKRQTAKPAARKKNNCSQSAGQNRTESKEER